MDRWPIILASLLCLMAVAIEGKVTFEKMTNRDYPGTTYYTIRNVSLYECLGWCRDEVDCTSAAFSFVVNPLAPIQETTCMLQNSTQARINGPGSGPTAVAPTVSGPPQLNPPAGLMPQKAVNLYFFNKVQIRSDNLCNRLWAFERFPNRVLRGLDNAIIYTSNKEACLTACLNEVRFVCRSVEFNYITLQCHLSEYDRRSPGAFPVDLVEANNVDYFENACLNSEEICQDQRAYDYAKVGLPLNKVAHYVELNYYPDKELLVKSQGGCLRACSIENEFICRSVLYRSSYKPGQPNCALYHLDHKTFPDGPETYATPSPLPLLDSGETSAVYLEASCTNDTNTREPIHQSQPSASSSQGRPSIVPVSTSSPIGIGNIISSTPTSVLGLPDGPAVTGTSDPQCDSYGVCYDVSLKCTDTRILINVKTSRPFHGRIYALGRSETCNAHIRNAQQFQLDMSLMGGDCNTQNVAGVYTNTVVLQHHNVVLTKADKVYHVRCTYETTSRNVSFGMLPIRDPDTLQITAQPEAPLPKISIFGLDGREASTVRIGDRLTFRIEIPENTPYGIFARSCIAMAKDARSTFEIIDEHGCPVDNSIFPNFLDLGNALQSEYEAFRFTESYGVIFQCNVKYCIGKCEPVICGVGRENVESWGKRRRRRSASSTPAGQTPENEYKTDDNEMTLSKEILVLDINESEAAKSKSSDGDFLDDALLVNERCASRSALLWLSVFTCLLIVPYLCTIIYFTARRRIISRQQSTCGKQLVFRS